MLSTQSEMLQSLGSLCSYLKTRCCGWLFKILPVRQYRISCILSQSVHNNRFIECYLVPDYQEVKYILECAMLISTTARRSSDESSITYRVASFQILRVRQSRISWFRVNTDRKNRIITCCTQDNCATHKKIRVFLSLFTRNLLPDTGYFENLVRKPTTATLSRL